MADDELSWSSPLLLMTAKQRVDAARLTNVEIFCGFIDGTHTAISECVGVSTTLLTVFDYCTLLCLVSPSYQIDYDRPFDVGIALHACGEATDMVMQQCLDARAAYVLAPCCVGKVKQSALEYPRSAALRARLSRVEYAVLAKAADFGHVNSAVSHSAVNKRRRRCKSVLESDRNRRAQEAQYETFMFVMHPHNATPKNDILVGLPARTGEHRELTLSCDRVLSDELSDRVVFGL